MMTESSKNKVFILSVLIFVAVCLFLYFAKGILAPFLLAAFLTYLLSPLVTKIQSYGYRRWVGVAVIAAIFLAFIAALLIIFIPIFLEEIDKLSVNIPTYYNSLNGLLVRLKENAESALPMLKEYNVADIVIDKVKNISIGAAQRIPQYVVSMFSIFSLFVLIPLLSLFMLLGGEKTVQSIVEFVPEKFVETILAVIYEIDSVLGRFIRGQLIEASFVGVMSVAALSIFNVNFALIIGLTAGVANLVPYAGPTVGLLIASAVALIQYQSVEILFKVIPAFLIIQFLDNNFVQPFAVGQNVNLGPVTMIFVMLAGAQIFGFLGIVFAVPVAAIIKTIFVMLFKKYKNAI
ncbi:AI-2E family transporter [Endomicrobium proavitum]|uniref:Permease n=1 Tax=Endomicrobium proavitum TaxID=1408281 RepID=A0A0G3WJS5_9BACT|nr:AI-2E family transporter [Endomicrobium proavitum]AKL98117.1 conserved membrane protein of unknown function [Endomicrobium proavitum]